MARARKKNKGKGQLDNEKDKHSAAATRQPTRSSPRRTTRNKRHVQSSMDTDDYQLRHSIEVDGTMNIVDMNADGNCLFRSLSDQLYGDYGSRHDQVRTDVCDFIEDNADDFRVFLVLEDDDEDASDFETYVINMRQDGEWGGNLELVAAARFYRRKITVYSAVLAAFTIDNGDEPPIGPDLLLSFHDNDHYNSVRITTSPPRPIPTNHTSRKVPATRKRVVEKDKKQNDAYSSASSQGSSGPTEKVVKDTKQDPQTKVPKKKNSPCPCGSGLRYKRCCFITKKKARAKKSDSFSDNEGFSPSSEDATMKGDFRVLQI